MTQLDRRINILSNLNNETVSVEAIERFIQIETLRNPEGIQDVH